MEASERIQGKDRLAVLNQLKNERARVKVQLMDRDYEQLTMIIDIHGNGDSSYFRIDTPPGFHQAVDGLDVWEINFEFTSRIGIQYEFKTSGGRISGDEILINFPNFVQRIQRRKDFRLEFPPGTAVYFEEDQVKYKLNVINLSMGGTLGEFTIQKRGSQAVPMLSPGKILKDIEVISPFEDDIKVLIKKALILRLTKYDKPDRYCLGLQFTEMANAEIKALKKLIYDIQKTYVRKKIKAGCLIS